MKNKNQQDLSRRDFIKLACTGSLMASSWISGCHRSVEGARVGKRDLYNQNGKPLLVSVEGKDSQRMFDAAMEALGGLEKLVAGGKSALLKPNFVYPQSFPITTDPDMIFMMANRLRKSGASEIEVFDSPGTFMIASETETFRYNDIIARGKEIGIAVNCGDSGQRRQYLATRKGVWKTYDEILIHKKVYQTPVVINMPCLKRHHSSFLTCALKNNFGVIYGPQRWDSHIRGEGLDKMSKKAKVRQKMKFRDELHFMHSIAEFADAVQPELTFVDARAVLTKGGPTKGKGKIIRGVNRFILSWDMVAIDAYCSRIMEAYDKTYTTDMVLPTLQLAEQLGLGSMNLDNVEIIEIKV